MNNGIRHWPSDQWFLNGYFIVSLGVRLDHELDGFSEKTIGFSSDLSSTISWRLCYQWSLTN